MKRFIAVFLSLSLLLMFGCKKNEFPVSVYGVEITKAKTRSVSLSPNIDCILEITGCDGSLVGVSDFSRLKSSSVLSVGTGMNPDADGIIYVSPDVVFTHDKLSGEILQRLAIRDISVINVPVASTVEELEDIYKSISACFAGEYFGNKNGEEAYKSLKNAISSNKVKGVSICIFATEELDIVTGGTFISDFIEKLGFKNVAEESSGDFSKQQVVSSNPDIIVCISGTAEKIKSDSVLSACSAVKNGKVYEIDENTLTGQGENLKTAASMLHSFVYGE